MSSFRARSAAAACALIVIGTTFVATAPASASPHAPATSNATTETTTAAAAPTLEALYWATADGDAYFVRGTGTPDVPVYLDLGAGSDPVWLETPGADGRWEALLPVVGQSVTIYAQANGGEKSPATRVTVPEAGGTTFIGKPAAGVAHDGDRLRVLGSSAGGDSVNVYAPGAARSAAPIATAPVTNGQFSAQLPAGYDASSVLVAAAIGASESERVEVRIGDSAVAAPTVSRVLHQANGDFTIIGTTPVGSKVSVRQGGVEVGAADEQDGGNFRATVASAHSGQTVDLVATIGSTSSAATKYGLTPPPIDDTIAAPDVTRIITFLDGSQYVTGKVASGTLWVLDGNKVVAHDVSNGGAFLLNIPAEYASTQLDVRVFVGGSMSARSVLPRTLTVDGLQESNSYTPGKRTFAGTAEAGATITATDKAGTELFSERVSSARAAAGTWTGTADLSSKDGYELTFTQTTTDGRSSVLQNVAFTPTTIAAPEYLETQRGAKGEFRLYGTAPEGTTVVARVGTDEVASGSVEDGEFVIDSIGQEHLGKTVSLVARDADGGESAATAVELAPAEVDPSITQPVVRTTHVFPGGTARIFGADGQTGGVWLMDGDTVVDGGGANRFVIDVPTDHAKRQLDLVTIRGDKTSERVPLPRLLQVDGLKETNTYTPGKQSFDGTAEAGATIVATDQTGTKLFETKVNASKRANVGTWNATADLTATTGYQITFTQTTSDGRTSVMENIGFTAAPAEDAPFEIVSPTDGSTVRTPDKSVTFTGSGKPGGKVSVMHGARQVGTQIIPASGTWTITGTMNAARYDLTVFYKKTATQGNTTSQTRLGITVEHLAGAPFTVTSPTDGATVDRGPIRFEGTGKPGGKVSLHLGGTARGTTTVSPDGAWHIDTTVTSAGTHTATVYNKANPSDATATTHTTTFTTR